MPRTPLEEALDSNSSSPFANLKEDPSDPRCGDPIWRARSYTEGEAMSSTSNADENQEEGVESTATALHASFDAAFLENDNETIFRTVKRDQTASWDGYEMKRSESGDLVGRKHLRVTQQEQEEVDVAAPGTAKKHQRTGNVPPQIEAAKTPGRRVPRPGTATKKTPTSAARRRRTPMRTRHSPRLQQRRAASGVPPTPLATASKVQEGGPILQSPVTPKSALFGKPPPSGTPTRATPKFPQTAMKAPKLRASFTGTTASVTGTSLDISQNTEDTASPTPFRFSTFPASLPRVSSNPRTANRGKTPLYSSRKAAAPVMDMEVDGGAADVNFRLTTRSQHSSHNSSREEEGTHGTHNSSLSSWSGETGNMPPPTVPSFPPTVLEWKSPESEGATPAIEAVLNEGEGQLGVATMVHTKLFAEDEHEKFAPSDEESMGSPVGSQVTRTKLNFNSAEKTNGDEERVENSDLPGEKEIFDGSSLSPNRSGQPNRSRLFSKEEIGLSPVPQVEEQFLFRIDSHCSPIPGIPDDEGLLQHSAPRSRRSLPSSPCEMEVDGQKSKVVTRARKNRPPLIPASSPRRRPGSADVERRNDTENDESSRLSLSQESEDSTSTTGSSKARRLRPMPDMSAFEAGTSLRSASTVNTTGDSSPSASEKRTVASSPKLVCPPTPVRTPAWAHPTNGAKPVFERSNSLIATKVLATCPVNVLDGHSSLENSLLDDDENEPYAPGFPTVEEVPENTSDLPDTVMEDVPPKTRLTRHSSLPLNNVPPPPPLVARTSCSPRTLMAATSRESSGLSPKTPGQMKAGATRLSGSFGEVGSIIAFARDFENLGKLGSGAFADVFKVRSRLDGQLYAVKRNRRQFRGKRDREMALAEVRIMQQLQSVCAQTSAASAHGGKAKTKTVHSLYVLFFFQAWQEEGYFFCQTELCCRDTCRELIQSLRGDWPVASQKYPSLRRNLESPDVDMIDGTDTESNGRLMPEMSIWKICHDVAAGLSHVHAHRIVHYDIKLSNIFFISHSRLGAMCKIGDFGMAGQVGSSEDGQEGDTMYMAPELLQSGIKHASADIFSLGLSLYELASAVTWELPSEGPRWLELRSGSHVPELPPSRSKELSCLIQSMIHPEAEFRPTADDILDKVDKVKELGSKCDPFLRDYVKDVEEYDRGEEQRLAIEQMEADERGQTPRNASTSKRLWRLDSSSGPSSSDEPPVPMAPVLFSPQAADTRSK